MAEKRKPEEDKCAHPLMCADEWKDPEGAKVLAEYHKDDEAEDERRIEEDLDAFERYWQKKHGINFQGEYHKEGAPYMESPSGWDGHRPRSFEKESAAPVEPRIGAGPAPVVPKTSMVEGEAEIESNTTPSPAATSGSEAGRDEEKQQGLKNEPLRISEVVDINTLEVVSYWIFRLAFGKELHIPIKKEGVADIDVHIRNKDVILNTNQLYFVFPELVVWHITYTHKGRPVLEIGRGVKKGIRVHRFNALRLLVEVWMGSRRAEKESMKTGLKQDMTVAQPKGCSKGEDLNEKGDIT